jgi:hypothetical protein
VGDDGADGMEEKTPMKRRSDLPVSTSYDFSQVLPKWSLIKRRSPLTLNVVELAASALAVGIALAYVHWSLWEAKPYGYFDAEPSTYPGWYIDGRDNLFRLAVYCMAPVIALAGISVIRYIRDDVKGFSRLGYFAMASPLLSLPFVGCFSPIVDLLGIVLAVAAAIQAIQHKENFADLVTTFILLFWLGVDLIYTAGIIGLVSD